MKATLRRLYDKAKNMEGMGWRKLNRRLLLVLLLAFLFLAQPNGFAERLPIKTYTTEDGLIRNLVRQILQDSNGYLWLVTPSGLSRFDGYEFRNYAEGQNALLSLFWRMIEDRRGGYWVATGGGGLYRFRPEGIGKDAASRFQLYKLADNPQASYVFAIHQDRSGKVWAGGNGGLFCMDEANGETQFRQIDLGVKPEEQSALTINSVVEGVDGSLWISANRGLFRYLPTTRVARYNLPDGDVWEGGHIFCDRNNRLWAEHSSGLFVFLPESPSAVQGDVTLSLMANRQPAKPAGEVMIQLPSKPGEAARLTEAEGVAGRDITEICQSFDGKIWLGLYDKGLLCFDGRRFRLYTKEEGLSHYKVRSLVEDREGNLWIGTDGGGLMKKIRGGFTGFSAADGLEEALITFVIEDAEGAIGVATEPYQVKRFDGEKFHTLQSAGLTRLMNSLMRNRLNFYYTSPNLKDHTGELWFATADGLYRFPAMRRLEQLANTTPKAIYTTKDGLPDNRIYRLFEDSRRDLWISFLNEKGGLLSRWERATNTFYTYTQDQGLVTAENISSINEDRKGNIWLGFGSSTSGAGMIARFDGRRFRMFTKEDGVPVGSIRDLFTDSKGRLWIASSRGGIAMIADPLAESPAFSNYTIAGGLIDNETNCVAEDRYGNIYVGMGRGLDRIEPSTGRIRHFKGADGLTSDDVRKIFRDSQMNLWIGTNKGLFRFIPEPESPKPAPAVFITKLIIAGEEQTISDSGERQIAELELTSNRNNLLIDFVSPGSSLATTIRYKYKLEGADTDWSPLTDRRSVNYANLSPGSYRFLVQAINGEGIASSEPATMSFTIQQPVWRRWWFITLSAMMAGLVIYGFARFRYARRRERKFAEAALQRAREERLLELEQVRRRIATDLHDDVGSSLTQISLLSEVVRQSLDANPTNGNSSGNHQEVNRPLTLISQISQELVDSMSDIVWAINPQKDTLKDLSQRMRHFASDVLTARQIEFRFRTPDEDEEQGIKVGANQRREVYLLFKEAVNNLVKHSLCRSAEIELRLELDTLFLEISDDGQGFALEEANQGNGLQSMGERSRSLGGEMEIRTAKGEGTSLSFMIPLNQQSRIVNR
jgi:ligand-binding sensor domain-containing protein/signal transduction histidine kinase